MLTGLARKLVSDGSITEAIISDAICKANNSRVPLVSYLVDNDLVESETIAQAAGDEFGIPVMDLSCFDLRYIPSEFIKSELIIKNNALPLYIRANRLYVALTDPANLIALDEIKFHARMKTEPILVEENKLKLIIDRVLQAHESASVGASLGDTSLDDIDISSGEQVEEEEKADVDIDDAPIVRYVHKILLDAINMGASDVHFEPYEYNYRIRFRQDGILREIANPPISIAARLSSRIKIISRLDISEKRIPQDGRFKLKISKSRSIDFRVSTCPTLFGEKVVLRILDASVAKLNIDKLGLAQVQKASFLKAIKQPQGMVLVTGPTGSGKTVSLYTALNILNTSEINISTAEDPVEINLQGINQVNMNVKAGLTFASALRSFLRQDPDIIMVGEIRDLETAEIAIKAAQTGHMVLSTLHTNSAAETLTRLINMGVASYNIATSVSLIVAQRLARKLCENCKQEEQISEEILLQQGFSQAMLQDMDSLFKAVGCDHCQGGYKGRVGIYEVMPVSEATGRIIMASGNAIEIADQAQSEGVSNLRQSGLYKIISGVTSIEEINRVTKD